MAGRDPYAIGGAWDQDINVFEVLNTAFRQQENLLSCILIELRMMNVHLESITDEVVGPADIQED